MKKRITIVLSAVMLWLLTSTQTCVAAAIIGTGERAMSPKMTSQSCGARLGETALGSYAADSMRTGSGADIAILCGGDLVNSLPGGPLTQEDARGVFAQDLEVAVTELTPAQLFDLLEYAVGTAQIDENERLDRSSGSDCFPQISGFSFEFDVSQLPGRRLRRITLADGTRLDREDPGSLTAALPRNMLDGTLGFSMLEGLDCRVIGTQSELLIRHIQEQEQVAIPETGRISMVGAADDTLYSSLHLGTILPYVILLVVLVRLAWRKRKTM